MRRPSQTPCPFACSRLRRRASRSLQGTFPHCECAGVPSGALIYPSTKVAFARWIRRNAASTEWAAAGIPLNAVAPAIVLTPMVAPYLETEEGRRQVVESTPMPLNGFMEPIVVARLLAWVAGPENTHLAGQVVFVDGGYEVVTRGDSTW